MDLPKYTPYTEDKLYKGLIERVCPHCKTDKTCRWRKSPLSRGEWRCNKCGLFESRHSKPHPSRVPQHFEPRAIRDLIILKKY
ncbi:hypothetical protein C8R42DRAFT_650261 [Lentinula raphanica]|nr:hypothetical protein C8R42DRAFT_650261 [Lentinula raphanica]